MTGEVGAGKSLIAQRLAYGLISHGTRLTVVSTELTTRGWLEQVDSLGYSMTDATENGSLTLLSRCLESYLMRLKGVVQIADVLDSKPVQDAEIAIIDRASSILQHYSGVPEELLSFLRNIPLQAVL